MALGQDESVVVRVLGVFRVEPHDREEQGGDDVCCRAATRRMPATGFGRGANAQDPQSDGVVIQRGDQGNGGGGRGGEGGPSFLYDIKKNFGLASPCGDDEKTTRETIAAPPPGGHSSVKSHPPPAGCSPPEHPAR